MKNSNLARVASTVEKIRRWLKRRLPNTKEHEIDDLVQRVCLIAVHKLGNIPEDLGQARVNGWLWQACKHVALKHQNAVYLQLIRSSDLSVDDLDFPPHRLPSLLTEEIFRRTFRRVWLRMSWRHRALILMWIEGRSPYEIADTLNIGVTKLYELRREIIDLFEEEHDGNQFSIIPPCILRSQHAHPMAWMLGTMATVALLLWLASRDADTNPGTRQAPVTVASPEVDEDPGRPGGSRRPPEPAPPRVPPTVAMATPAVEEVAEARLRTDGTAPESARVSKRVRGRRASHLPSRRTGSAQPITRTVDDPITPVADTPSPVEQEAKLLSDARTAYHRKDYATAQMHLDEHARRFPTGALATDREKLEVPVLCALGRTSDAEITERVLRTHHDPGPLRCEVPRRRKTPDHRTQTR